MRLDFNCILDLKIRDTIEVKRSAAAYPQVFKTRNAVELKSLIDDLEVAMPGVDFLRTIEWHRARPQEEVRACCVLRYLASDCIRNSVEAASSRSWRSGNNVQHCHWADRCDRSICPDLTPFWLRPLTHLSGAKRHVFRTEWLCYKFISCVCSMQQSMHISQDPKVSAIFQHERDNEYVFCTGD